jgi:hypothetical protein
MNKCKSCKWFVDGSGYFQDSCGSLDRQESNIIENCEYYEDADF